MQGTKQRMDLMSRRALRRWGPKTSFRKTGEVLETRPNKKLLGRHGDDAGCVCPGARGQTGRWITRIRVVSSETHLFWWVLLIAANHHTILSCMGQSADLHIPETSYSITTNPHNIVGFLAHRYLHKLEVKKAVGEGLGSKRKG